MNTTLFFLGVCIAELIAFLVFCTHPSFHLLRITGAGVALCWCILQALSMKMSHDNDGHPALRFLANILITVIASAAAGAICIIMVLWYPSYHIWKNPQIAQGIKREQQRKVDAISKGSFRIDVQSLNSSNEPQHLTSFTAEAQQSPIKPGFCRTAKGGIFCAAILAAEDHDFYKNHKNGRPFSRKGLARAAFQLLKKAVGKYNKRVKGGSGIALQVAKLLYPRKQRISTRGVSKTIRAIERKLFELNRAHHLTRNFTAEQLLATYINLIPSVDGKTGFPLAYRAMFGNNSDCPYCLVYLAGTIKAPANYRPWNTNEYKRGVARANWILSRMREHFPHVQLPKKLQKCTGNSCLGDTVQQQPAKVEVSALRQFIREKLRRRGVWQYALQSKESVSAQTTITHRAQVALAETVGSLALEAQKAMGTEHAPTVCGMLVERTTIRAASCSDKRSNFLFYNHKQLQGNTISMGSFSKLFWAYTLLKYNPARAHLPFPNNQGSYDPVSKNPHLFLWNGLRNYKVQRDHPTRDAGYLLWGIKRSENQMAVAGPRYLFQGLHGEELKRTMAIALTTAIQWQIRFAQAKQRHTSEAGWLAKHFATSGSTMTRIMQLPAAFGEIRRTITATILEKPALLREFARIFVKMRDINGPAVHKTYLRYRLAHIHRSSAQEAKSAIIYAGNPEQYAAHVHIREQRYNTLQQKKEDIPYSDWPKSLKGEWKTLKRNIPEWKARIADFQRFAAGSAGLEIRIATAQGQIATSTDSAIKTQLQRSIRTWDNRLAEWKTLEQELRTRNFALFNLENLVYSEAFAMYAGVHLVAYEITRLSGYDFPVNVAKPQPPQPSMILGSHEYTVEQAAKAMAAMTGVVNPRELTLLENAYTKNAATEKRISDIELPSPIGLPFEHSFGQREQFLQILRRTIHPRSGWATAWRIRKEVPKCFGGKTGTSQSWLTTTGAISICGNWTLVVSLDKRQIGGKSIPGKYRSKVQGDFMFKAAVQMYNKLGAEFFGIAEQ